MDEIENVETPELPVNGKTVALVAAATAVGVGVAFVVTRVIKKYKAVKNENELFNETEEAAQN